MNREAHPRDERGGQILVLFALGIVAVVAMVGLVLDGGDAFNQRRGEQNGADLAALAGANAYLNTYMSTMNAAASTTAATSTAQTSATGNGYTNGAGSTVAVTVSLLPHGATVQVDITKPHQNSFARVMGMNTWDVSVTATAITGSIDTAVGAAPWIMDVEAFNADGTPKYTASNPQAFGDGNGDYPINATDIAWTDFNGNNNVNTSEVAGIIQGTSVVTATFSMGQYLGQHNQGNHTALFSDVDSYLAGKDIPVPITGPGNPNCQYGPPGHTDGCFYGWAMFHVISASGASSKTITGYFSSDFRRQPMTVGECTPAEQAAGQCIGDIQQSPFGAYVVRLSN
jgi:Putative Flp pilus-assembly TadE/G-like